MDWRAAVNCSVTLQVKIWISVLKLCTLNSKSGIYICMGWIHEQGIRDVQHTREGIKNGNRNASCVVSRPASCWKYLEHYETKVQAFSWDKLQIELTVTHLRTAGGSVWRPQTVGGGDGVLVPFVSSLQLLGVDANLLALLQQQLVLRHLHLCRQTGCTVLVSYQSLQHHREDSNSLGASVCLTCLSDIRCPNFTFSLCLAKIWFEVV